MSKAHAVAVVATVAFIALLMAMSTCIISNPPAGASDTYRIHIRGGIAEDSCSRLRVIDYEGGLDGSTYRCVWDD